MSMKEQNASSVKHLADLYAVVVGAALTSAIYNLFSLENSTLSLPLPAVLLFSAFLVTIVPFYHGALRHLDNTYIFNRHVGLRRGALLLDFSLLFLHGIGFISLSRLVSDPGPFFMVLVVILFVDAIWGVLAQVAYYSSSPAPAEKYWGWINLVAVLIAALAFVLHRTFSLTDWQVAALVAIGAFARTLIDYLCAWGFYFPDEEKAA